MIWQLFFVLLITFCFGLWCNKFQVLTGNWLTAIFEHTWRAAVWKEWETRTYACVHTLAYTFACVCVCTRAWCVLVPVVMRAGVTDFHMYSFKLFHFYLRFLLALVLSANCLNLQNLLSLNPKIKPFANVLPSAQTKENKLKWKRNANRNCDVSTNYVLPFLYAS